MKAAAVLGVVTVALILALQAPASSQGRAAAGKVRLEGAGATFPALLNKKWIALYAAQHPDVVIDYKDVGSGEGVRRFLASSVDFGASDGALTTSRSRALAVGRGSCP